MRRAFPSPTLSKGVGPVGQAFFPRALRNHYEKANLFTESTKKKCATSQARVSRSAHPRTKR
eukprot:4915508-Prymnesium_polylepis.1